MSIIIEIVDRDEIIKTHEQRNEYKKIIDDFSKLDTKEKGLIIYCQTKEEARKYFDGINHVIRYNKFPFKLNKKGRALFLIEKNGKEKVRV